MGPSRTLRHRQRGLIVAPPRSGKTMLLQNIAQSIGLDWVTKSNAEFLAAMQKMG